MAPRYTVPDTLVTAWMPCSAIWSSGNATRLHVRESASYFIKKVYDAS